MKDQRQTFRVQSVESKTFGDYSNTREETSSKKDEHWHNLDEEWDAFADEWKDHKDYLAPPVKTRKDNAR